jgi:hypothetical protein
MRSNISNFRAALLALLALPVFALPARAADTTTNDMHCLVIGAIMGSSSEAEVKNAGVLMTVYYLGRLDGSGIAVDFSGGYKSEIARIPQMDLEVEAKGCSTLLTSRGTEMTELGKALAAQFDAAPPATPGPAAPATPATAKPAP